MMYNGPVLLVIFEVCLSIDVYVQGKLHAWGTRCPMCLNLH